MEKPCPHCEGGHVFLLPPPSGVTGTCHECGGTGITETETEEEEEMTPSGEKLNAAIGRFADDLFEIHGGGLSNLNVLLHVLETVHGGICHAVAERLDEERDRHTDAQAASMLAESQVGRYGAEPGYGAEPEPEPEREKPENWPWGFGSFWDELRKAGIPVKGRP